MRGWVYVMGHQAMPGYVRVGHAYTDPAGVLEELNALPLPGHFRLLHDVLCEHPEQVAQRVMAQLGQGGAGHGWYRCAPERAIQALAAARSPALAEPQVVVAPGGGRARQVANGTVSALPVAAPAPAVAARAEPRVPATATAFGTVPGPVAAAAVPAANQEPVLGPALPPPVQPAAPIATVRVPSYEEQLAQRREAMLERYDAQLRRTMPDSHLWSYFFGLLVTFLVAMELLASFSPNSMFVLATLGAALGSPLIRLVLLKRHKQSPQYRQLLQQRENELASLEREYERRRNFSSRFRAPQV